MALTSTGFSPSFYNGWRIVRLLLYPCRLPWLYKNILAVCTVRPFLLPGNRQHVGASVHHDEEEHPSEVETLQIGVVLHHQIHQVGHLLHQDGVEGQ